MIDDTSNTVCANLSEIYGASPYIYGICMATPILPSNVKTWEPATCTDLLGAAPRLFDEPGLYKEGGLEDLEYKTRSSPILLYKEDPRLPRKRIILF